MRGGEKKVYSGVPYGKKKNPLSLEPDQSIVRINFRLYQCLFLQTAFSCLEDKPTRHHGVLFFSSRRRHTSLTCDWSSDVCSSDLGALRYQEVRAWIRTTSLDSTTRFAAR